VKRAWLGPVTGLLLLTGCSSAHPILYPAGSWLSHPAQRRAVEGQGVWRQKRLSGPASARRAVRLAALFPEQSAGVQ
jgi:hypothetical protein